MISGTHWPAVNRPQGRRFRTTFDRAVERFRRPTVTADKFSLSGFSFSTFRDDYRDLEHFEEAHAVGFDLDGEGTNLDECAEALGEFYGFLYSSYRHTSERQRGRAIIFLDRTATADEYRRCWRAVVRRLPTAGQESKDASRLWFAPGVRPGGEYRFIELRGGFLDVDEALACTVEETSPIGGVSAPVVPVKATTPIIERARKYLEHCDVAVSGQRGHLTTFIVAQKMVRGFQLDKDTAYSLLSVWNQRCRPEWSEAELRRKIQQAADVGDMKPGSLLNAPLKPRDAGRAA
jgi:hypothetical protein